jgi:hypothetical protein
MQRGATSIDRIARGSFGVPGPPIITGLSESRACSAPCDPPPTCAPPPGSSNSAPGAAVAQISPLFGASRTPAIRSKAFGYSVD